MTIGTGVAAPWPTDEHSGRNIGPEGPGPTTKPSPFADPADAPEPESTTMDSPFVNPDELKPKSRRRKPASTESEVDPAASESEVDPAAGEGDTEGDDAA